MTTNSKTHSSPVSETAQLASAVCDLWQEHLARLAADPAAKVELSRLLEPQRKAFADLFADYAAMVQNSRHGHTPLQDSQHPTGTKSDTPSSKTSSWASSSTSSSDDSALRLAQLAHRVAALEERISQLESSPKRSSRASASASRRS